jgi:hypothetical protein
MAIMQLNNKYRVVVVFVFFASLLLPAIWPRPLSYAAVTITSIGMVTIPCGQRFINRNRKLWILRQSYFAALALAYLWLAVRNK